jgi:hypothetical protein
VTGVIKARPTLYKGIQMRSRLEADFAGYLDRQGFEWEYESECYAGPDDQWLPDFHIRRPGDQWMCVELKPAGLWLRVGMDIEKIGALLRKMTVAWLTEPDAELKLVFWEHGSDGCAALISGIPGLWRGHRWVVNVGAWPTLPWPYGPEPDREAELPVCRSYYLGVWCGDSRPHSAHSYDDEMYWCDGGQDEGSTPP